MPSGSHPSHNGTVETFSYPDDQLRITSTQREHAIELLRQAAADGRLDFEEMNARLPIGLEARTQGELRRIVGDLVPSAELAAFLNDMTPPLQGPGATWDNPLVLGREKTAVKLEGTWEVPPFIELYCSVWHVARLDFVEAVALAPVIDLVVVAHGASPQFIFPPGWGADTERLTVGNSGWFTSNVSTRPEKGLPRVVLRGHVGGGKARYETPRELRKRERQRAKAAAAPKALPA